MTRRLALVALCAAACAAPSAAPLDDEGWNAQVDPSVAWAPVLGEPRVVVPDRALPVRPLLPSNNNVSIALHEGRLYLAWRSAETHFASANARLHVLSSGDLGQRWVFETTVALGADVREPLLLSFQGRLWLHWFEAGTDPLGFEPRAQWRSERTKDGWAAPERWGRDGEITWELRARQGSAWRAAYLGEHYRFGEGGFPTIELRFERASDGVDWQPLAGDGVVYRGGVSEASFEFDAAGDVWAVTRNEDGDATGFGSHVCVGRHDALGQWECSAHSDPERYDSPRLFRHGDELYLLARRDVGGPFDLGRADLTFAEQQLQYALAYSGRPKRTALYRLDRAARRVVWLFDLPSAGDTAFPSVVRLDAHRFLVANYTSPLDGDPARSWWAGQNAPEGTRIYLVELRFEAAP